MTTPQPLPLSTLYNLDLEPVPTPDPGVATIGAMQSLYARWMLVEPKTLTLSTAAQEALMRAVAARVRVAETLKDVALTAIYGIPILIDETMEPGTWKLTTRDTEIDSGVIRA